MPCTRPTTAGPLDHPAETTCCGDASPYLTAPDEHLLDDDATTPGDETPQVTDAAPTQPEGDNAVVLLVREAPLYVTFLDTSSGEVRILRRAADRETYQPYVSLLTDGGSTANTTRIAARIAALLAEHDETPHTV